MSNSTILAIAVVSIVVTVAYLLTRKKGKSVPEALRRGRPLPDFHAVDENGDPVRSTELHGTAAVMLFVRGNWCPFCNTQVEALTRHYKSIIDLGARLVLMTPKPLQTTRRVAEFFEVEFEFWLDEDLNVAKQLGLLQESGVPEDHRKEYGEDTVWPTAIVVDANSIIRYAQLSKLISDRPDPEMLLRQLRAIN